MPERNRGMWERIVGRRKKSVGTPRTFRPSVEELAARIVPAPLTLTWNGGSTDWGKAANWDDGSGGHAVPGANDNVVLKGGTPNDPIISANATIGSITTDLPGGRKIC